MNIVALSLPDPHAAARGFALTETQLKTYLARIGVDGPVTIDREGLTRLHRAHLLTVTWEAIDCFMGWPVSLDPAAAHAKIVHGGRGGWCFEMNGLFGAALQALGFQVMRLAGCVDLPKLGSAAIGNHLTLRVDLERPYLAEVGVADALIDPVPMALGEIEQRGFAFRIDLAEAGWLRLHNHEQGIAGTIDLKPDYCDEAALQRSMEWLVHDVGSPFRNALAVFRHVEDGYFALQNDVLRRVTPGGAEKTVVSDADHLAELFDTVFALNVPQVPQIWDKVVDARQRSVA
ncbi:arylamine N-acetyltransferase [Sphingobium sp. LB126]|nr:arylamine N-acetyltransferase [Sphingobium sp. LB126]